MRTIAIVVALLGVIVFSKFYLAGPSASDGQQIIAKFVSEHSMGNVHLASFKQTNGKEYMLSGVRVYVMNFEGTVECGTTEESSGEGFAFAFDRLHGNVASTLRAGESRVVRGSIQFEKTAYAWVGQPM